jgi:hypothetical protein
MENTERFLTLLWAVDGCRCEHWSRQDGAGESIRLYQHDLLLSRKRLNTAQAVLNCAADWREVLTLG